MLVADQQASELAQPGIGSLDDPAAEIAAQFPAIFVAPFLIVFPVGHNQFNASLLQALTQWVGIVSPIRDHVLRLLPRAAPAAWNPDFGECGFRKRNLTGGGAFQPNSQRKTLTVDQYHPLRPLAPLGFTDGETPFFAGAKLPSKKVSSHFSRPCSSSAPSKIRHAFSHTPSSSHCCSRRQQGEGEGNSSGKNRHAAPVCRIHKMPSKQPRFDAHGRPRLSRRRLGGGSIGSTNSHCSSGNSLCRFFITEAHQLTRLIRKYLW